MFIKLLTLSNVPPQRSLGLAYGQSRREGACKIQMERRGGENISIKIRNVLLRCLEYYEQLDMLRTTSTDISGSIRVLQGWNEQVERGSGGTGTHLSSAS